MLRSSLATLACVTLLAACVNVAGPSAEPSITPGSVTPAPTSAPTATATATAAPTVTVAPTLTAAPSATAAPSPEPTEDPGFDQRDVDFLDDLGDPTGHCTTGPAQDPPAFPEDCFGVGDVADPNGVPIGSVVYNGGALAFTVQRSGGWVWSPRLADSISATMRVIGDFHATNEGRFGVLCATADDRLFGAVVGTDGSWAFIRIDGDGLEDLFGEPAAGLDVAVGESNLVALECAGTATGALRMTLWLGQSGPVATWTQPNGPENWDRAAAFAEAVDDDFGVTMDNVVVFGSGSADGSYGPEGEALLAHVPEDWRSSCYPGLVPPYLARTAEAVVSCFLSGSNTDGAELAEYVAFSSAADMDAAYQRRIDAFGSGNDASSCRDGSAEGPYTIGGVESGRLLCIEQFAGIRFDWTDNRLNILGSLVDFDGDYSATFDDWIIAGPDL